MSPDVEPPSRLIVIGARSRKLLSGLSEAAPGRCRIRCFPRLAPKESRWRHLWAAKVIAVSPAGRALLRWRVM